MRKTIVFYKRSSNGERYIYRAVGVGETWVLYNSDTATQAVLEQSITADESVSQSVSIPKQHVEAVVRFLSNVQFSKLELDLI